MFRVHRILALGLSHRGLQIKPTVNQTGVDGAHLALGLSHRCLQIKPTVTQKISYLMVLPDYPERISPVPPGGSFNRDVVGRCPIRVWSYGPGGPVEPATVAKVEARSTEGCVEGLASGLRTPRLFRKPLSD